DPTRIIERPSSMPTTLPLRALGAFALAAAAACSGAHAADTWAATRTLKHEAVRPADVALAPDQPVHVAVSLRLRHQDELDALTTAMMSGHAARPLSRQEFVDRFAPTPAQAEAVASHLRQAGFAGIRIAPNRLVVSADGTAATVRTAFDTQLRRVV